ncbi:MAG: recombinase family protein, partial [Acidobacteria bacterium]|nr:recombinase family protein [Acidobacteriota bacterium]
AESVRALSLAGISKSEIARRLKIGRTSVRHLLEEKKS